jgi:hypothetical protein
MEEYHREPGGKPPNPRALSPEEQIKAYYTFGYKVLVLGDKNPFNPYHPKGEEWQNDYVQEEDALAHCAKGGNIGLQMGAVSDWLCAVDLDTEEVRRLAPKFLRETLKAGKEKEDLLPPRLPLRGGRPPTDQGHRRQGDLSAQGVGSGAGASDQGRAVRAPREGALQVDSLV